MERKKGIPLVALVIFIVLLVAIILTCVIILGTNKKKTNNSNESATPQPTQVTPTEPEEEKGEEYTDENAINNDKEIQSAYKMTGNDKTFAKYALYASKGFNIDENNIDNELKLQLAAAQITNSDMDSQSSKKSVSKDILEGYIEKVFGSTEGIEYKDFTLYNSDTNFTEQYKTTGYKYDKNNASYELIENDVDEEEPSEIVELITKVVKYNSKIEIYVKPIFVQTIENTDTGGYARSLYKNYDFESKEYPIEENIIAITNDDYMSVLKSSYNQDVDRLNYKEVNKNIDLNQLKEYKYTLTKTENNEYNLKSFEEIVEERKVTDDNEKEMTEQEKALFNNNFDSYTGSAKTGTEVNSLLDAIVTSNETNIEKKELIVGVTFNEEKITLEDDKVDELNEKISALTENISNDKKYTVKAVYKSGLILSVTITEEGEPEETSQTNEE